jgi:hypothetical protein
MKAILHNGQLVAFAHGLRIKLDPTSTRSPQTMRSGGGQWR